LSSSQTPSSRRIDGQTVSLIAQPKTELKAKDYGMSRAESFAVPIERGTVSTQCSDVRFLARSIMSVSKTFAKHGREGDYSFDCGSEFSWQDLAAVG